MGGLGIGTNQTRYEYHLDYLEEDYSFLIDKVMGLGIYIVAQFRKLSEEEHAEFEEEDDMRLWPVDRPDECPEGYPPGVYFGIEVGHSHIGSYGGFKEWRGTLSAMLGKNRDEVSDQDPFGYLLNHSDCDGILVKYQIDSLKSDFANHKEAARNLLIPYHFEQYEKWERLLIDAHSKDGVLYFS